MNWFVESVQALPFAWAQYSFMAYALAAILLITPVFALLGCLVVSSQLAFLSDAIGHAALTGVALGVVLGAGEPLGIMILYAVLLAVAIALVRRYSATSTDTAISLALSFSVALGVVILSRSGGMQRYTRYLVGDILTITPGDIRNLALMALVVAVLWAVMFNQLFLMTVSRSLALSRGMRVWLLETLFTAVVAVCVTVCIAWIGLLVINSLLILPAAAARNLARSARGYVLWSLIFSVCAGVAGLLASYYWAAATGATIALVAALLFVVSLLVRRLDAWRRSS